MLRPSVRPSIRPSVRPSVRPTAASLIFSRLAIHFYFFISSIPFSPERSDIHVLSAPRDFSPARLHTLHYHFTVLKVTKYEVCVCGFSDGIMLTKT